MAMVLAAVLLVLLGGGAVLAYAGGGSERTQKRVAALATPANRTARLAADANTQRKRNMATALKEFEKKQAENRPVMTMRRRLDQAGLANVSERNFYISSAVLGVVVGLLCIVERQSALLVALPLSFAAGVGLPRWVLMFLKRRREKRFTDDFANAIDVIVRSVKSGLPTSDALRIVGQEFREPVRGEFKKLVESMKVGVTLEQGLKKMYENMPTTEVSFFGIVLTIQQKTGGNLSEALGNLASVLRDRKRLQAKIKAMSSEAKASAAIIGSLPPGVAFLVYLTTPDYISTLFTERTGNLLLAACAVWMSVGIAVMRKMINFKH